MPSLDAGKSTLKRGIRTTLASIHTTSIQSLYRNSSPHPYELPILLLQFSEQAPSSMSSNSMPISSPLSSPIHWLPSTCPPPNQPLLVGQLTLTVSSILTTISMSLTLTTSVFMFFTISVKSSFTLEVTPRKLGVKSGWDLASPYMVHPCLHTQWSCISGLVEGGGKDLS